MICRLHSSCKGRLFLPLCLEHCTSQIGRQCISGHQYGASSGTQCFLRPFLTIVLDSDCSSLFLKNSPIMHNPFQSPSPITHDQHVFGDFAVLKAKGFLFRIIKFTEPKTFTLTYSGWWFRQRVWINDTQVFSKISWLNIDSSVRFNIEDDRVGPDNMDDRPVSNAFSGRIEIDFTRGLQIRRFRVWIDESITYDEIV